MSWGQAILVGIIIGIVAPLSRVVGLWLWQEFSVIYGKFALGSPLPGRERRAAHRKWARDIGYR